MKAGDLAIQQRYIIRTTLQRKMNGDGCDGFGADKVGEVYLQPTRTWCDACCLNLGMSECEFVGV